MELEDTVTTSRASAPKHSSAKTDRRAFIAILCVGFVLFLGAMACAPGTGFIFRTYSTPSSSMVPTLRVGGYAVASRAAYGYSRYSFDLLPLPIESRFPMNMPQRGDIVVFKLPRDGLSDWVKRVIGLPGDKVQMVNGHLIINGQMIPREPVAKIKTEDFYGKMVEVPTYRESLRAGESHMIIEIQGDTGFNDNTKVFDVPQGQYFVMGDNRDNSTDSRVPPEQGGVGFVPLENLIGPVVFSF